MKRSDENYFTILGAERHMEYVRGVHSVDLDDLEDAVAVRRLELAAAALRSHGIESRLQYRDGDGIYWRYLCVYNPTGRGSGVWATAEECRRLLDTVANLPAAEAFARWAPKVEPLEPIKYTQDDARRDMRAELSQARADYDSGKLDAEEYAIARKVARRIPEGI